MYLTHIQSHLSGVQPPRVQSRVLFTLPDHQPIQTETPTMTISKLDQIAKHYAYVTKHRPWLIPTTWATPAQPVDYTPEAAKSLNARLKDAYRHRMKRAQRRAHAVVEATTKQTSCGDEYSRGIPKTTTEGLPRGWRSRELRGNRSAPGSSESMRKQETSNQRARLRITPWSDWSDWT
jgi:hypothetical protein